MAAERTMISGFGNHHTNKGGKMPYTRITLTDIRKLVDTPQQVDKSEAQWLIPSSLESRVHAEQAKDGQFWALWADVDWKEAPPKPMAAVASCVAALTEGADYEVYASRGATEDRQKCRILIPLGEPLCGSDWIDGQRELNALLAEAGIEPDTASERTGQLCYLPNRGQWYDTITRRNGALFDPMTAWSGLIADRRRIEAEQAEAVRLEREKAKQRKESLKSSQVGNGAQSLIEVFNQAFHVADILVQAGYDQRGDTFRHPNSETGSFSASVKDGRVHTLSSADPLWTNGEGAHDAFSAFCALFHQGDMPRALRDAGDNWITIGSESWNQVHRRKFAEDRKAERELDEFQAGPDPNTPPPVATDAMFYGIVGEVGRAAAQDTEVNPVAAAAAFLSYLSAQVGRDTYLPVGNTFHHSRLFTCHVGRSGRGRKGDAVSLIHRIRSRIEEVHTLEKAKYHGGGLSTREGLALLIHDGYTQGKTEVPPEDDKRLWIVENEFANVLHQSKRDGNTLSAALRDAWDGMSIKPAIKTAQVWATDPHIALHASVTPGELRDLMSTRELSNGFANRFLMLWAERSKVEPFPRPASRETVHDLADRSAKVITFALGSYPATKDTRRMELSDAARNAWDKAYRALIEPEATDTLTGLLERSAPYALRLAMLFALTDQSLTVELKHLKAGLAWVKYSRQSVRYIFTTAAELADSEVGRENADKILEFLGKHPDGASRTTINNDCFEKRASASRIDDAIKLLLSESPPKITVELVPRADKKPGKPTKLYRLFSKSEPGISGISSITEPARPATIRTVSGVSGIRFNGSDDPDLIPAKSANSENAETRANRLIDQSPQIPGTGKEKTETMSAKQLLGNKGLI